LTGMGLAPGGRMKQEIYDDPYGLDAWDQRHCSRCFITIANAAVWTGITSERPPSMPPTAADYAKAKLPWFDYYGGDAKVLPGSPVLGEIKSVLAMGRTRGTPPLPENNSAEIERIITLRRARGAEVRETPFDAAVTPASPRQPKVPHKNESCQESDRRTWGYRDFIIQALLDLGGESHRPNVISQVYALRKKANATLPQTFDETVQQAFERHCGQSMIFCGDAALDLFSWPKGKGDGTWGINRPKVDAYLANRAVKNRIPSLDELA
jgi:hypothetical protein